jgi:hypothetical protein
MADETPGAPAPQADTVTIPAESTPVPPSKGPGLAETIRLAREERERSSKASAENSDLKKQLSEAMAALKAKESDDPLSDPVGWAKARKLAKEDQVAFAEALLYDLVPEKAPPEFRVKFLEAKVAREARNRQEAEQRARQEAEAAQTQRALKEYEMTLQASARAFKSDSHPESEAWFGDDKDTYARSLLATARNMADIAAKEGRILDLSPGSVADVLEKDIARRMAARDSRRAGASKSAVDSAKADQDGRQPVNQGAPTGNPMSTRGMTSGGPRSKAVTDRERVARAIAAGFKARTTAD